MEQIITKELERRRCDNCNLNFYAKNLHITHLGEICDKCYIESKTKIPEFKEMNIKQLNTDIIDNDDILLLKKQKHHNKFGKGSYILCVKKIPRRCKICNKVLSSFSKKTSFKCSACCRQINENSKTNCPKCKKKKNEQYSGCQKCLEITEKWK